MVSERFQAQTEHYYENALNFLRQGETQKAAELLWGSIAEALKAVAATRGLRLRNHREIWEYARELARETSDESMFDGFREAHALHTDFYEAELTIDDVRVAWESRIRPTLQKLAKMAT
jgi:hypothetical protein